MRKLLLVNDVREIVKSQAEAATKSFTKSCEDSLRNSFGDELEKHPSLRFLSDFIRLYVVGYSALRMPRMQEVCDLFPDEADFSTSVAISFLKDRMHFSLPFREDCGRAAERILNTWNYINLSRPDNVHIFCADSPFQAMALSSAIYDLSGLSPNVVMLGDIDGGDIFEREGTGPSAIRDFLLELPVFSHLVCSPSSLCLNPWQQPNQMVILIEPTLLFFNKHEAVFKNYRDVFNALLGAANRGEGGSATFVLNSAQPDKKLAGLFSDFISGPIIPIQSYGTFFQEKSFDAKTKLVVRGQSLDFVRMETAVVRGETLRDASLSEVHSGGILPVVRDGSDGPYSE